MLLWIHTFDHRPQMLIHLGSQQLLNGGLDVFPLYQIMSQKKPWKEQINSSQQMTLVHLEK